MATATGNAYFWVGQDGQYYIKNAASGYNVVQGGAASPATTSMYLQNGWTQIPDPAAGSNTPAPTNPTGATHPALNTAGVGATQTAIDQLPGLLQAALSSEDQTYANTNAGFDSQEQQQRGSYDTGTTTNQQNYDQNFMDSIRAGIKGLGSLVSLLRGSGAAGGTAEDNVRDVVGGTTADDIRTGADTQKNNQVQLDSSLGSFLTDLKGKRQVNADTHTNNARAIQRNSDTQLQDLYGKMAGFYGDAGNTGAANDWTGRAASLTPNIAANTRTAVSSYDQTPVVIHAPNLTAFTAPSQPAVATAPQDGQVGSGIFAVDNRRKDNTTPVAPTAPVAAPQGA